MWPSTVDRTGNQFQVRFKPGTIEQKPVRLQGATTFPLLLSTLEPPLNVSLTIWDELLHLCDVVGVGEGGGDQEGVDQLLGPHDQLLYSFTHQRLLPAYKTRVSSIRRITWLWKQSMDQNFSSIGHHNIVASGAAVKAKMAKNRIATVHTMKK